MLLQQLFVMNNTDCVFGAHAWNAITGQSLNRYRGQEFLITSLLCNRFAITNVTERKITLKNMIDSLTGTT